MDCFRRLKGTFPTKLFIFTIFTLSSVVINLFHLILLIFVKPLSRKVYFSLAQYINWTFIAQSVYFYEFWSNSDITFYCKRSDYEALKREKVFVIANHSHDIDIPLWMVIMNHFGKLGNDICYAKDYIKYIPFIGWHIYLSQHILVKGCYAVDRVTIEKRISQIRDNGSSVWVVFMPEGPKFTKERHAEAIKFGLDTNIKPLMHHLIPRTKGFTKTYEALRKLGYETILNAQIAFDVKHFAPPKLSCMMQCRRMRAHVYLERIPIDDVENNFNGIYKIFKHKDELHEYFIRNGNFKLDEDILEIPMQHDKAIQVNFYCWCLLWIIVMILSCYNLFVYFYLPDMRDYSHLVKIARIACDIHDIIFDVFVRPVVFHD